MIKKHYILAAIVSAALLTMLPILRADEASTTCPAPALAADMALPFRDNAVLQRGMQLPVWGQSLPGARITVEFDGQRRTATADAAGKWRTVLAPLSAVALASVHESPPGKTMTVTCEQDGHTATTEIRNLLVGDVWLCAGQSNMAGTMRRAIHPKNYPPDSIPQADYPALRLLSPEKDRWLVSSPATAVEFSRVAFYFIRRVQRDALVPMGVMVTAVGGSNIESWLNQAPYPVGNHYNRLVEPLVGYGIRGAVWYQGESNEDDRRAYHPKLKSLIEGWRHAWQQVPFPLHFVQLPGLKSSDRENPAGGDGRAEIRQAFVDTLALENTGMAVTIDIGTPGEHPPNKFDTGVRLARSVLNKVYGFEGISACPLYQSHRTEGDTIRVAFTDDADDGLMIARKASELPEAFLPPVPQPNAELDWLAIQAADGSWHWAKGRIDGSELIVSAKGVTQPKAVRYAYTAQPLGNLLYNQDGMPVGPFSTCGYDSSAENAGTGKSADEWQVLFAVGDDLSNWKVAENPDSIRIEDGLIVCHGERAHAFYIGDEGEVPSWKNFEAEIEFMTFENANGGLFFHADWQEKGWPRALECQMNVSHQDHRKTGSIYAFGDIEAPGHQDGEWVTLRLKVVDQTVTVFVNGKQHNQWTQPDDHKLAKKRLREGTFALQAHDPDSRVKVRSLKVRRLP